MNLSLTRRMKMAFGCAARLNSDGSVWSAFCLSDRLPCSNEACRIGTNCGCDQR